MNLRKRRKERTNGRDEGLRLAWRKDRGTHLRASPSLRVCLWPISTSVLRGEKVLKQLPGSKRSRGEGLAAATLPQASGEEEPKLVRVVERDRYVNKPLFLSSFFSQRDPSLLRFPIYLSPWKHFLADGPSFPTQSQAPEEGEEEGILRSFLISGRGSSRNCLQNLFFPAKVEGKKGGKERGRRHESFPLFSFVRSSTSSSSAAVKRVSRQQFATRGKRRRRRGAFSGGRRLLGI